MRRPRTPREFHWRAVEAMFVTTILLFIGAVWYGGDIGEKLSATAVVIGVADAIITITYGIKYGQVVSSSTDRRMH